MNRKPIRKIGKKGALWIKIRAELKRYFDSIGIRFCELRFAGCLINRFLGFAHRLKRRKITTEDELRMVCLACQNCHSKIEVMQPEEMFRIVTEIIENRETVYADS